MKPRLFGYNLTIERLPTVLMVYNGILACMFLMGFYAVGTWLLVVGALLVLVFTLRVAEEFRREEDA